MSSQTLTSIPSRIALHTANSFINFLVAWRSFFSCFNFSFASAAAVACAAAAAAAAESDISSIDVSADDDGSSAMMAAVAAETAKFETQAIEEDDDDDEEDDDDDDDDDEDDKIAAVAAAGGGGGATGAATGGVIVAVDVATAPDAIGVLQLIGEIERCCWHVSGCGVATRIGDDDDAANWCCMLFSEESS